MNLFNSVIKIFQDRSIVEDQHQEQCPYCHKTLKKLPGTKTKCQFCKKYMYVRTYNDKRQIVTLDEAFRIDWLKTFDDDLRGKKKEQFELIKEDLKEKFNGVTPTNTDVLWGIYNQDLIQHISNGDWGGYRCIKFDMAEMLRKEERWKNSVQVFLEVCYLDLNGPTNGNNFKDPELLEKFPAWNPAVGGLYYTEIIKKVIAKSGLSKDSVKEMFMNDAEKLQKTLLLPISPDVAWFKIERELF